MAGKPGGRRNLLLRATFLAMVLGIACGWVLSRVPMSAEIRGAVIDGLGTVTSVFLRLIRMIIAPLVLTTLIAGIARMDGAGSVGKAGLRTLGWFLTFSVIAILTGLALVNLLQPGRGLSLAATAGPLPELVAGAATQPHPLKMIEEFAPTSIADAMAQNRILQVVVFAIVFGLAAGALGDRAKAVVTLAEQGGAIMMKVAGYVMGAAPLAVFAALASTVLEHGVGAIAVLGRFVAEFYLALAVMALWLGLGGFLFLQRRLFGLLRRMREPLLVAFSTSSSEAAYAASLQAIEGFGVSRRIAGFVLPLGYAFNLDGSMAYSAFATLFVAQVYGVHIPAATQVGVMLFLMLASKGAAGVPRGALLGMAVSLQAFHLPAAGVALILAVDALLDMGRTTINVFGNAVATAAIARMEGELGPERVDGAAEA